MVYCVECRAEVNVQHVQILRRQHMQTTIARARTCMLNAQQRQKPYYDRKHVPSVFDVAADVLLATTNLHLRTTGTRKLIPRWVEPFKVLARMGSTAYCLDLPDCMHQVHNVFHVSLIKPYRSDGRTQLPPPPELVDDCPPGQYKLSTWSFSYVRLAAVTRLAPKHTLCGICSTHNSALACMQACSHSGYCMAFATPCILSSPCVSLSSVSQSSYCVLIHQ